jgi:prefoldin subunit 5
VVDTQYKEIIDYLKEARLDLENAEDSIMNMIKKIRAYLDENPDEEQFNEWQFLKHRLEDIEEIIEEIEDVIRDLKTRR